MVLQIEDSLNVDYSSSAASMGSYRLEKGQTYVRDSFITLYLSHGNYKKGKGSWSESKERKWRVGT